MTIEQAMQRALPHHQAGRLGEAEQIYRQVLAALPDHADALHMLGLVACQAGHHDAGVELIRRAVAQRPNWPAAYSNLGNALREQGRPDEAVIACRQAIACDPGFIDAHYNLGNALRDIGRKDQAIAAYRQAISLRPSHAPALNNLGNTLRDVGRLDEAIAAHRQAVALSPEAPESHLNLGTSLQDKRQLDEAIAEYRRAIALAPGLPEPHHNLGNALSERGQFDQAMASYRQALALRPNFPEAYKNRGYALTNNGQPVDAIASYRQAIALDPGYAEAHFNLALSLLVTGDFRQGWEEYEWRWKWKDFPSPARGFSQPRWNGGPLETRTLLLHAEQGLGDTLQFIRYLPLIDRQGGGQGGTIVIECQPALRRLIRTVAGGYAIVAQGETLPHFDLHCPLLSLPGVFGTTRETIPQTVPYIWPDPQDAGKWQRFLAGYRPAMTVGLVWAGNPSHKNDHNRSMTLAQFAPLGRVPGVRYFNLQVGQAAAEANFPPEGMDVVDCAGHGGQLTDFADTAGLVANLDLVISVDTSVAHLAGAMGKPVWLLLPAVPDWRWMLDREDSPWYPTMRIFRQKAVGKWDEVIERVAEALSGFSKDVR